MSEGHGALDEPDNKAIFRTSTALMGAALDLLSDLVEGRVLLTIELLCEDESCMEKNKHIFHITSPSKEEGEFN